MDILEALNHIDAASCDYTEWVQVGMALKAEGYLCAEWDKWSQADSRYVEGECEKKWNTFNEADGVTGGTIAYMAEQRGYKPEPESKYFDWDDIFYVDKTWVEKSPTTEGMALTFKDQCEQLKAYLNALFQEDEFVGFCVDAMQRKDEKWTPASSGCYGRTCGDLIGRINKAQKKNEGNLDDVLGEVNTDAGAWIRFNPLDGGGVKDANITSYRFALVESDTLPIDEQEAIIRELNLPVAALVNSGGKSVHAIVHIDALDKAEYQKRVEELYATCEKSGMVVDKQNKNPSRLSRMPGIQRGAKWQRLIDTNIGASSWRAWKEWCEEQRDDLADPVSIDDIWDNPPPLAEELIEGILRRGHKMLLSADSKSGKSFAMIELAVALAEGDKWLKSFQCKKAKVLYLNLEIDGPSFWKRVIDVYHYYDYDKPKNGQNLLVMNLRGEAKNIKELLPGIINKAKKNGVEAVIIDPIYKIITGDENSASEMADFCNQFDKLSRDANCSVMYAHHHSKGEQGFKSAQDRMSGSGVFARDPDAVIDMLKLNVTDRQREDAGMSESSEGLKMEFVLRDFASPKPMDIWFDYPIHYEDKSGILSDCPTTMAEAIEAGKEEAKVAKRKDEHSRLFSAYNKCAAMSPIVKVTDLSAELGKDIKTVRVWLGHFKDEYEVKNGIVAKK